MADPAVNTKVDRLAEAIENLALACAARATSPTAYAFDQVLDARQEMRQALADFLQPTLRVIK